VTQSGRSSAARALADPSPSPLPLPLPLSNPSTLGNDNDNGNGLGLERGGSTLPPSVTGSLAPSYHQFVGSPVTLSISDT